MFPFPFEVPIASQHSSPAASRSPPRVKGGSPNIKYDVASNGACYKETYAEKKANWKSSLRKPHPFLSREPHGGYQIARTQSNSSKSESTQAASDDVVTPDRPVATWRFALTLSVVILSATVLILGMIYADDLASDTAIAPTGESPLTTLSNSLLKSIEEAKTDKELLFVRGVTTQNGKRADLGPNDGSGAAQPGTFDLPPLFGLRGDVHSWMEKHQAPILASLFFYVAALPLLSIIHACVDLVAFYMSGHLAGQRKPHPSSPPFIDDDDSFCESDAGDINEEKFKHELAYPALPVSPELKTNNAEQPAPSPRLQRLAHIMPIASILSTTIIIEGWTVINGIQIHCEFTQSGRASAVCPSQLIKAGDGSGSGSGSGRQNSHSIVLARAVLSWAIVLIYIAQIVLTIKQFKVFSLAKFRGPRASNDTEANAGLSPRMSSSPRTPSSILSRSRSRSNSSRRKTVRFDLEESSRRQSERGEDVHYIPAPSDGYDNGYGLSYSYSTNHAYSNNGTGSDVRTPWQWQGQFEEFVNKNNTGAGVNTNTLAAATTGADLGMVPAEQRGASNFDFGLASMRRMAREGNTGLTQPKGFVSNMLRGSSARISQTLGLSSDPSTNMAAGLRTSLEQRSRTQASGTTADTSAVVPLMFSSAAASTAPTYNVASSDLQRKEISISTTNNGADKVGLNTIKEEAAIKTSPAAI